MDGYNMSGEEYRLKFVSRGILPQYRLSPFYNLNSPLVTVNSDDISRFDG